jgi:ribonucleoside-diphosphate reductase alpha chain
MYLHAWKQGLKTTYYLRSRPATRINKANAGHTEEQQPTPTPTPPSGGGEPSPIPTAYSDVDAVACSLENPESCEACQ